ncbi:hypothetical protein PSHT_14019 [Puccinia striiformis]|uniref:Secreted protein n=1 Tax=Puccinia striiformis TaxID=27350 RepID=A0A2S4UM81_9BASI|nr:hypothetical protein PSHT_14019 [Puccinia striiformis]
MQFTTLFAALAVFTGALAGPLRSLPQEVYARAAVQAEQDGEWGWYGGVYGNGKVHEYPVANSAGYRNGPWWPLFFLLIFAYFIILVTFL